jgi:nucleoside-diphosphate-sugar epimerase
LLWVPFHIKLIEYMEKSSTKMDRPLKILITGSTGFVGSHLCQLLSEDGHIVYGLARSSEKFTRMNINATCIEGSLTKDGELTFLKDLPNDLDVIFHTAGIVSSYELKDFYNVNYHATENLINETKERFPKLHFILISSLAAAGPQAHLESDVPNPVSHYGKSKLLAEKAVLTLAPSSWQKTVVRPPMVIGPGDPAVLDIFKMVQSKNILVAGLNGLTNEYSFICVYDLIQLLKKTLDSTLKQDPIGEMRIYFSSHPDKILMQELISSIQLKLNIVKLRYIRLPIFLIKMSSYFLKAMSIFMKEELRLTPDKVSELEPPRWVCSGKLSEDELDVRYLWNLEKTIDITLKDYQSRGWI